MSERCPLLDEPRPNIPLTCLEQCFERYDAASQEPGRYDDYEADCNVAVQCSEEVISVVSLTKRRYSVVDECMSDQHYPHQTGETTWEFDCPHS